MSYRLFENNSNIPPAPPPAIVAPEPRRPDAGRWPSSDRYRAMVILEARRRHVFEHDALGRSKARKVSYVRFAVWRELYAMGFSYPGIAKAAGRNHATIILGIRRLNKVELANGARL